MSAEKLPRPSLRNSRNKIQSLVFLVMGAGLILVAIAAFLSIPKAQIEAQQVSTSAIPISVDYPAPDVKLVDLDNQPVSLSDFKGQVVLYNSWATWCPPCKEEMPTLNAYYQAHHLAGFAVVAIEDGEPRTEVADYVRANGLTFPVWPDPKWVASTAFKTQVLPASFLIDRTGKVVLAWTGPISQENLEKYVTPIINQQ